MCLYPVYGRNPKFRKNKKNKGIVPICTDERLLIVPFKCGKCHECRKQKAREWRVRLSEELRTNFAYFLTLTFDNKHLKELGLKTGLQWEGNENTIVTKALRLFLERVRKETKKSLRHWFATELGEEKGRIHLHGIVFGQKSAALVRKHWNYGNIFIGSYVNERSISYITKYMTKVDTKHPLYTQIVLASKGIGAEYVNRQKNGWQKKNYRSICVPKYKFRNGTEIAMPKYYKDKLFSDKEREIMWINNLERGKEYIGGEEVDAQDLETIDNLRTYYQSRGIRYFNDNPGEWDKAKQIRREEKQKRYIKEAQRKLYQEIPLQDEFSGQKDRRKKRIKSNINTVS